MKKATCNFLVIVHSITVIFAVFLFFGIYGCSSNPPCIDGSSGNPTSTNVRPVIFVHGYAGSADQFETQAMRLVSNGYPASYISSYEYNSYLSSGNPTDGFTFDPQILSGLDAHINSVLQQTGADQVDLLGHSMGTAVCHQYLADAAHAAKVAHYVNIDGQQSTTPPGGVPTLALFAELTGTGREIGGATNITLIGMTHVQAVSSVESFVAIYKFFNNNNGPSTTDVLPRCSNTIELAGRIIVFMFNIPPADLTPPLNDDVKLDIYEVNKNTGERIRSTPDYSPSIDTDGYFKFPNATAGSNYEFNIRSTSNPSAPAGHYYNEPFVRSDYFIRLKYIPPSILNTLMDQSEDHSNLVVIRNKEFLGDDASYPNEDSLKINDVELCSGVLPLIGGVGTPIALFIFDNGSDKKNDLSGTITSNPNLSKLHLVSGVDFYMRAADPPDSTIPIVLKGRYSEKTQVVNVPNWQSTTDKITVQLLDY